jgi:hypothetical protein
MDILERHRWVAVYGDGTIVYQVDPETGDKSSYEDIDRDRLAVFSLWEWETQRMVVMMRFSKGQRLIWRRRFELSPGEEITNVCHIIGKQEWVNGKKYEGILGFFSDDERIEVAGRFEEGHPWFYPIEKVKGESWDNA